MMQMFDFTLFTSQNFRFLYLLIYGIFHTYSNTLRKDKDLLDIGIGTFKVKKRIVIYLFNMSILV